MSLRFKAASWLQPGGARFACARVSARFETEGIRALAVLGLEALDRLRT